MRRTDTPALQDFVEDQAAAAAAGSTYDALACERRTVGHETVAYPLSEHVKSDAHTNGIEFLRSFMKRAREGTIRKLSPVRHDGCDGDAAVRHNLREGDIINFAAAAEGDSKRKGYKGLIEDSVLSNGACK